jgi:hypothetical protein
MVIVVLTPLMVMILKKVQPRWMMAFGFDDLRPSRPSA